MHSIRLRIRLSHIQKAADKALIMKTMTIKIIADVVNKQRFFSLL